MGVHALLVSANTYLLVRADIWDAQRAAVWLTGSLNARDWSHATVAGVVAAGPPALVLTEELVTAVFGLPCQISDDPQTGTPLVIPAARTQVSAAPLPQVRWAG